jgi:hypothetical protein
MAQTPDSFNELIEHFAERAMDFIALPKREQIIRRWVPPRQVALFENSGDYEDYLYEIEDYVDDFLLSHPSAGGTTAFDRLARAFKGNVQEARAVNALRDARFRLIRLDGGDGRAIADCTDVLTDATLRIYSRVLADLETGVHLFCRLAEDNAGLFHVAGLLTPLTDYALDVATGPACPAQFSRGKESRWAEAIYMHIARNGTLDVPGLNYPKINEPPEEAAP